MFFLVIFAIWTVMHVYVFWRIASIPVITAFVPRIILALVALFLWGSFIVSRIVDRFGTRWLASAMEVVGADWVGLIFLIFVCLLVTDLATGFGFLLPRVAPGLRGVAVLVAMALAVIAVVQAMRAPVVSSYDVRIPGLSADRDGTVIVAVSDMHLGTMLNPKWARARIAQVEQLRPDMVILAGDIVEGHDEPGQQWVPVLRQFSAPLGVWAVNGNHEGYGREGHGENLLEESGIRVLRDQWAQAAPGLIVAGVDDLTSLRRRDGHYAEAIDKALAGRPAGTATVFISHTPWSPEKAAASGVGLMLSGHTHDGQIWPFTYVVKAIYPFIAGRYNVNGMSLIVCRGTGTWGPRMRLWRRGEIVKVTLHPAPTAAGNRN
jgi:predicted MPP superfamily phosphohydrolase